VTCTAPARNPGNLGVNVAVTLHCDPVVTLPVHVLPASVKSRFGAPMVSTLGVPNMPPAVTLKFSVIVSVQGAGAN
jgi:hypothetical protein